jgi:hypothetical protein
MPRITRDAVAAIAGHTGFPCVSIYVPVEGAGPNAAADRTAVKSAVQRAGSMLQERGLSPEEARRLVRPVPGLAGTSGAWHPAGSIAMFLAPGWFRGYRLASRVQPATYVGGRFLTRQLLPEITAHDRLLVLAISGRQARLIEVAGENDTATEVDAGLPQGLDSVPWRSEAGKDLQFHQLGRQTTAQGRPLYHGHGGAADTVKDRTEEYLRYVESLLRPALQERQAPLVLAGVESLLTTYRRMNSYGGLAEAAVPGNSDDLSAAELGERALAAALPELQRDRVTASKRHARLAGTARAATGLEDVLKAAAEGRVLHLFVANEAETWGRFDEAAGTVKVTARDDLEAEDLLDVAAQMTLTKGGDVHALPLDDMPGDPPRKAVVAVLRY